MNNRISLTATIVEEDGVYVAGTDDFPIAACGRTASEALNNLARALRIYLQGVHPQSGPQDTLERLKRSSGTTQGKEEEATKLM